MTTELSKPVRFLKGVGERLESLLSKKQIRTVGDLLYFFPRQYEDRRKIFQVHEAVPGSNAVVMGRVHKSYPVSRGRGRRSFECFVEDLDRPAVYLRLKWFHKPYALQKLEPGTLIMATGMVTNFQGQPQMVHPELEILGKTLEAESTAPGIVSIYSQTDGLYQKTLRKITSEAIRTYLRFVQDPLPLKLREERNLMDLGEAIRRLHRPDPSEDLQLLQAQKSEAHRRLVYDEFFYFSLALAKIRRGGDDRPGRSFSKPEKSWEQLRSNLSFRFTEGQRRVLKEILDDMKAPRQMLRMVQGDVGSGKTVVAAGAALVALESGVQVAMMAPTEVLIDQHREKFQQWFSGLNIPFIHLVGSLKASEKKQALEAIKTTSPAVIFGTHALLEEPVVFKDLGLVIVDEQHRFGVQQRAALINKGSLPDVLVMTATPIPRSLALVLYGDLDVSIINELPPGRQAIETRAFVERQRGIWIQKVRDELKAGRQAYMVFPLIEESEHLTLKSIQQLWPQLTQEFSGFKMGTLHGRMPSAEKQKILEEFRMGSLQILVSTTVIEVGVDIPNATVMIIENAERFGLSQLHQLRGRVGRGAHQSYCFLVASHMGSPDILQRLRTLENTQDGFKISEVDLEMRGPGEFLGTKQSGLPEFRLARLPQDLPLLELARRDAHALLADDPHLDRHRPILDALLAQFSGVNLG